MKRASNSIFIILFSFFLLWGLSDPDRSSGARLRKPVWAGAFYPANKEKLLQEISRHTEQAQHTPIKIPAGKTLKALILPHAGYIYSGLTTAHASRVISPGSHAKVILLGPDHRVGLPSPAVSNVEAYGTPLGNINLSDDAVQLRKNPHFMTSTASDRAEHSLEVILPFLQVYIGNFKLIPVVIGSCNIKRTADAIYPLLDNKTLLVASSDLSHYLPYDRAVTKDLQTITRILQLDSSGLAKKNCACGANPVMILVDIAKRLNWQAVLLHYSNSGDTAGSKSKVVGYAAIAFYGEANMEDATKFFDDHQGKALVKLARQTITEKLGGTVDGNESESLKKFLTDKDFTTCCGTFVTLHINGQLRGCIGSLTSSESVVAGVQRNAINAAFNDARFRPLTPEELDRIDIEVSVLTEPKSLAYTDGHDLLQKLRPTVDGVIIRQGFMSATFLPQVWSQLPRTEDFLAALCRKAGLPTDAWRTGTLQVETYQVQYFAEEKPISGR